MNVLRHRLNIAAFVTHLVGISPSNKYTHKHAHTLLNISEMETFRDNNLICRQCKRIETVKLVWHNES